MGYYINPAKTELLNSGLIFNNYSQKNIFNESSINDDTAVQLQKIETYKYEFQCLQNSFKHNEFEDIVAFLKETLLVTQCAVRDEIILDSFKKLSLIIENAIDNMNFKDNQTTTEFEDFRKAFLNYCLAITEEEHKRPNQKSQTGGVTWGTFRLTICNLNNVLPSFFPTLISESWNVTKHVPEVYPMLITLLDIIQIYDNMLIGIPPEKLRKRILEFFRLVINEISEMEAAYEEHQE